MACKKQNNSFKRSMCGVVMKLLGKGICYAYKVDSRVKEDLDKICGYTDWTLYGFRQKRRQSLFKQMRFR